MKSDGQIGEGTLLRLLGLAHAIVGIALYRREIRAIGAEGVLAGIPYRGPKATPFWFLMQTPMIWIVAGLVGKAEEAKDWRSLRTAHRVSAASALVAIVLLPVSGFWGWLAVSLRGLRRVRAWQSGGASAHPRSAP